jgi:hypothetical protein
MDPTTMHMASPPRTSASTKAPRPWADLPPDLLQDVSACLHNADDTVCFHAVCRPPAHAAVPALPRDLEVV